MLGGTERYFQTLIFDDFSKTQCAFRSSTTGKCELQFTGGDCGYG